MNGGGGINNLFCKIINISKYLVFCGKDFMCSFIISHLSKWFDRFSRGEISVDLARSGRPSSSQNDKNIEKNPPKINEDRRFTIDKTSEQTGTSRRSCK
ncbi:hypothetical protein NPIL_338071 [Nephila pilipes]|uniref:Uncharacterized protein n=1 Tax=Nephila pilipes TaxID=299642 RepID=A0A8X6UAR3_NEPPI|nr:hypothetical protein NPIL_338071 [Nephila pilipes]